MLSRADELLVSREPALPGLATLLDIDAFVALLRMRCPEVEIRAGQATYVRYKPQTNCLVTYRLQLAAGETFVYAIAHCVNAQDKLSKTEQGDNLGSALGPGYIIVTELALVIYGFPNDRKLKALSRLADPTTRQQLFQRLLPECPEFWTGDVIHLRYKPERRYVARLQANGRQVLVKFYTDEDYANVYAGARAFTSKPALRVAQLLGHSHRHQAQAWEWLSGQPLDEALQAAQVAPHMLYQVVSALAVLHARKRKRLIHYAKAADAAAVQAAAAAVTAICPQWSERTQDLARHLTARFESTTFTECAIHSDFSADQVLLLEDGGVGLLDLDNVGMGDPMADLGAFAAQCYQDTLRDLLPLARAEQLTNELVEAYRLLAPHAWDAARFQTHLVARLLRLAPEPFRRREPDWVETVAGTLQLAEEISNHVCA
jgi:aminoglycoside phosphotransferase (APT) family kinase protein